MLRRVILISLLLDTFAILLSPTSAQESCPVDTDDPPEIVLTLDEDGQYAGAQVMLPALVDYLNGGGSAQTLPESLKTATQVANAQNTGAWGLFWRWRIDRANVFGDEALEFLVEIAGMGGKREDSFLDAALFAFTCQEGSYRGYLVGRYGGTRGGGLMDIDNGLFAIQDMTGDGVAEVVVTLVTNIGIHAYYDREFMIFGWDGEQFIPLIPRFEGMGTAYSTAYAFWGSGEITDTDGDGTLELILTGSAFRHHDFSQWSRLDRGDVLTWGWNGTMFEMVCKREVTPAQFRVQLLVDASDSLACGDVEGAIAAYERVIADDTLLPWTWADNACPGCDLEQGDYAARVQIAEDEGIPVPDPAEWPRLSAYARFRLVQIYTMTGDGEAVLAHLEALGALQADVPGYEYRTLAETFWQAFEDSGELGEACQVMAQAAEHMTPPPTHGWFSDDPSLKQGVTSPLVDYNFLIYMPLDEPLCIF